MVLQLELLNILSSMTGAIGYNVILTDTDTLYSNIPGWWWLYTITPLTNVDTLNNIYMHSYMNTYRQCYLNLHIPMCTFLSKYILPKKNTKTFTPPGSYPSWKCYYSHNPSERCHFHNHIFHYFVSLPLFIVATPSSPLSVNQSKTSGFGKPNEKSLRYKMQPYKQMQLDFFYSWNMIFYCGHNLIGQI